MGKERLSAVAVLADEAASVATEGDPKVAFAVGGDVSVSAPDVEFVANFRAVPLK